VRLLAASAVALLLLASPSARRRGSDGAGLAASLVVGSLVVASGVSPVLLGAGAGLAAMAAFVARRRRRLRRQEAVAADAVSLAFGLAAELRAGRTPVEAIRAVGPSLVVLGPSASTAAEGMSAGMPLGAALEVLSDGAASTRIRAIVGAWTATAGAGAGAAGVLDRLGSAFEADDESAHELEAVAAGPQATVVVLTALPLLGVVLGRALGLDSLHVLLHSGVGAVLLVAAVLLDLAGLLWVRRILRAGRA
jgi:tight adherence protein B